MKKFLKFRLGREFLFFLLLLLNISLIFAITGFATEQISPSNVTVQPFVVLRDSYDGVSSNFTGLNESILRNMSSVVLENTTYGKIEFNENLDLVTMGGSNLTVNFDRDINISDNLIYVDNYYLPGINKSANLSLYGITLTTPVIYHNAVVCTDCTLISYSSGIYKFKVDSFSGPYYLREGSVSPVCGNGVCESGESTSTCPSDCPSSGGGGGGGGGGSAAKETQIPTTGNSQYDFSVNPSFFQVRMNKGTYYQKKINVTNNGTNALTIFISVEGLEKFIFPEVGSFTLKAGESKLLRFDIYVSSSRPSDVYTGKINFKASQLRKESQVVLQVLERDAFFDIRTQVLKKYIPPGGRVRANISLINMGDLRNFDVQLEYKIIDFDKNEYTLKKEDFAIEKYYNNIFYLDLPKNMSIGNYLFYSKVRYKNVTASSYDTFVVEEISTFSWILLIIIILIAIYLVYRIYRGKKAKFKFNFKKGTKGFGTQEQKVNKQLPVEVPKLPEELE